MSLTVVGSVAFDVLESLKYKVNLVKLLQKL